MDDDRVRFNLEVETFETPGVVPGRRVRYEYSGCGKREREREIDSLYHWSKNSTQNRRSGKDEGVDDAQSRIQKSEGIKGNKRGSGRRQSSRGNIPEYWVARKDLYFSISHRIQRDAGTYVRYTIAYVAFYFLLRTRSRVRAPPFDQLGLVNHQRPHRVILTHGGQRDHVHAYSHTQRRTPNLFSTRTTHSHITPLCPSLSKPAVQVTLLAPALALIH